MSNLYFFNIII